MVKSFDTLIELVQNLNSTFMTERTKALIVSRAIDDMVICDGKPSFPIFEPIAHAVVLPIFPEVRDYALRACSELREMGIRAIVYKDNVFFHFDAMPAMEDVAQMTMCFGAKSMELFKNRTT